jgi:hypothetical protein
VRGVASKTKECVDLHGFYKESSTDKIAGMFMARTIYFLSRKFIEKKKILDNTSTPPSTYMWANINQWHGRCVSEFLF